MSEMIPVRICNHCGHIGEGMDTFCQRCLRRGTLEDRYRCPRCAKLADDETCSTCAVDMGIREANPRQALAPAAIERPIPDLSTSDPPPWLAGLVGGIFFGAAIGAGLGIVFGEAQWLTAIIGAVLGGVVGATVSANRV